MSAALPNLVVIGAMKCGTTSLRHYLDSHPEIQMAAGGLNFFLESHNWHRGLDWYRSHFEGAAKVRGDTSPRYANHPLDPGAAEKMYAVLPNAKLLYLVRDPIERLVSHYCHAYADGIENRSLEEALADTGASAHSNPYVCRSLYQLQLDRYLAHYPMSQLLVIHHEDLRDRRQETLRAVFRFLEVDDSFVSSVFDAVRHRTADKRRWTALGRRVVTSRPFAFLAARDPASAERLRRPLERTLSRRVERPLLSAALRRMLMQIFRDDLVRPPALAGRYADRWKSAQREVGGAAPE